MGQYCCFKGRGNIAVVKRADYLNKIAGFMKVGNASTFNINISETSEDVQDYTSSAGGIDCNARQIQKVEFDLSMMCHTPENLARASLGSGATDNVAGAAIAAEPQVAWPGAIVPLDNIPDRSIAILVKSVDDATPYVEGTDYNITEAGSIEVIEGGSIPEPTITDGVGQPNIHVSYTSLTQSLVQLLTSLNLEYVVHFDGVNIVTGDPAQFDLFRVKMSPAKTINGISDNAGKLDVAGSVLRDASKPFGTIANPLSQYGTLKLSAANA